MTQLRKFPDSISNYFDDLERGIGKRGSTFTNIDACTHDLDTQRFLFREFKHEGEPLCMAQRWVLNDLAVLDRCTVWIVRKLTNGRIGFEANGSVEEAITVDEYRARLARWWRNERQATAPRRPAPPMRPQPLPLAIRKSASGE